MKRVTDALLYPWLYEGRSTETEGEIMVKWLSFVSLPSLLEDLKENQIRELIKEAGMDKTCSLKCWIYNFETPMKHFLLF